MFPGDFADIGKFREHGLAGVVAIEAVTVE